jgi:protein TonB
VLLEVLVTEKGRVGERRVAESSGHELLDKAALQAVEDWRFSPGRRGHRAVAMRVLVPVRFQLQ